MLGAWIWGGRCRGGERGTGGASSTDGLAVLVLELLGEQMGTVLEVADRLAAKYGDRLEVADGELYPLVQYLEDRGFVAREPLGGSTAYTVTEAGFAFVAERSRAEAPPRRGWHGHPHHGHAPHHHGLHGIREVYHDLHELMHMVKRGWRSGRLDEARLRRVHAILDVARRDLSACLHGEADAGRA